MGDIARATVAVYIAFMIVAAALALIEWVETVDARLERLERGDDGGRSLSDN